MRGSLRPLSLPGLLCESDLHLHKEYLMPHA